MKKKKHQIKLGRPFKKDGNDTKTRIIEASLELFASLGFAGTSVRQIARAVGVSEAAIYAHFEGKRAIYDALFAETGPPVVINRLNSGDFEIFKTDPKTFLLELGQQIVTDWDEPQARKFISVLMREGAFGAAEGSTSLASVVEQVQKHLGEFFRHWMDEGLVRQDFSPEHLVWEMIAPLANLRFLYLHAQASEAERRIGRDLAKRHLDYFVACAMTANKTVLPKKPDSGKNKKAESSKTAKRKI